MGYPKEKPVDDYILQMQELSSQLRVENRKRLEGDEYQQRWSIIAIDKLTTEIEILAKEIRKKTEE